MPTNRSRTSGDRRRSSEAVDADPDGADEVALPGERDPLHETPETGGIVRRRSSCTSARPRPEIGRVGRARRRDEHRAEHGSARRRVPAVIEQRVDHVGEIVPTEEEPGGRWSAQARGQLLRAQLVGEQRRLPPVVRLALEPDRPPLDLRRARARSEGGRTASPSNRRGSPAAAGRLAAEVGAARARRTASSRAAGTEGLSRSGWPRPCSAARADSSPARPRSTVTPIATAMWSTASSSNPLTNVASQSNSRCSSSSSNRYDQAIVACRVPCRSSRPRRTEPPSVTPSSSAREDPVHAERRRSSRGQLDRERQAVETSAEVLDGRPLGAAEIGPRGGRPLPEEVDRRRGPVQRVAPARRARLRWRALHGPSRARAAPDSSR